MDAAARQYLNAFAGGAVRLQKDLTRGVAVITLDNPEKRNAISGRMMVELHDHIRALESWEEGKACVLRGSGGNFSSGGDLDFVRASGTLEGSAAMNYWMTMTLDRLSRLKMFSVCVLEGPTLGGGTEVALACDFIVALENVQFGVVHGKLGIVTAWGGGTRLTRRIGKTKALDLLLTSRILTAKDCINYNIVDDILVSTDDIHTWLDKRLQHHHTVTRAMKEITMQADQLSLDEAVSRERDVFLPFWGGQLNKKALDKRIKHVTTNNQ